MHTREKPAADTYPSLPARPRSRRKKKQKHRIRLKAALCACVFTLAFAASAKWHILKPHTDSRKQYSARTSAMLTTEPGSSTQPQPATDELTQEKLAKDYLKQEQLADTTADETETMHIASVSDEWNLILVNPWNEIPQDYEIHLADLPNGQSIDSRCYIELTQMINDCRLAGMYPLICSSYRTQEKQEALYQERIDELRAQGFSAKEARKKAATSVARPGTSEHQAGLAVDIVDSSYQALDSTQEYTPVQQWLMSNCWKYGFILRYPSDKSRLTGIIYEPWHYRYVGKKAAKKIYKRGLCLEEYLEGLI